MSNTHIIDEQSLNKMAAQVLVVKIVSEKAEDLWRTDVNIAILPKENKKGNK